jgi:hypothetical protein
MAIIFTTEVYEKEGQDLAVDETTPEGREWGHRAGYLSDGTM